MKALKHTNEKLTAPEKVPRLGIAERSQQFSHILCPHCSRKFGEKAAARHIAYCAEQAKLK